MLFCSPSNPSAFTKWQNEPNLINGSIVGCRRSAPSSSLIPNSG